MSLGGEASPHLRCTFDAAAEIYDQARPSYPAKLFDDLIELAELNPGARLLEVGCGTGKATLALASRGFAVVCVELGANLADQARANLAGYPVEVEVAPFETWADDDQSFDLVYAATAWRWIDPTIRYARAHAVLRPGGHLAFWNAVHAFPPDFDPFFADIQAVYDEIGEGHDGEWPPPRRTGHPTRRQRSRRQVSSSTCRCVGTSGRGVTPPTSTSSSSRPSLGTSRWSRTSASTFMGRFGAGLKRARIRMSVGTGSQSSTSPDGSTMPNASMYSSVMYCDQSFIVARVG